ncbi:MAG: UDP-N-acetylglucosamine--N-acetylmuramyl-(pentapeptide) pyrophosphoryl-undecaprenol N-acetylglucosamine transferase [Candidatus Pacebacteria bacterium]|nr:UDP-N-acetylglucosamine--N-acetylmuramyl-(pentapeptide) pyrophosphoryl-undecaprenol N-acetylglucosamine transferase [Candidatus Paceibacterota bacterium]
MKILLTGGGTGGHVYPLIAVAEELNRIADEEKIINFKLYYASDTPYDTEALRTQFITFVPITAGKLRVYFSFQNFIDIFKTGFGVIKALFTIFRIYPDVVISKGGYASFPVLCAARVLRIPVIIHESDTVPGRVNLWSGKFAKKVALSFPEAASYFKAEKISITGQPVRKSIIMAAKEGALEFFEFNRDLPVVGIFAGSQGAQAINEALIRVLPSLIGKYQIIHQTGEKNFESVKSDVGVMLGDNVHRTRYKPFPFLNDVQTKMFGGASTVIVGRSGSSLFEIAAWGKPSILIPYPIAHGDHQRKNAYHYARTGACVVIEEANLTPSVLMNEIDSIVSNPEKYKSMSHHAKDFFKDDAAREIAIEAVKIALSHEK